MTSKVPSRSLHFQTQLVDHISGILNCSVSGIAFLFHPVSWIWYLSLQKFYPGLEFPLPSYCFGCADLEGQSGELHKDKSCVPFPSMEMKGGGGGRRAGNRSELYFWRENLLQNLSLRLPESIFMGCKFFLQNTSLIFDLIFKRTIRSSNVGR